MSVGSGFDAYVKSDLHAALYGPGSDPMFEFDAIFTEQVEEHNRDFTRKAGKHIFECYKLTRVYDELLALLQTSTEPPQFESKVEGLLDGTVPYLGKPDLRFVISPLGVTVRCVLDWKVKGYCSKYGASPSKGYALCRDAYGGKQSQSHLKEHKNYLAYDHHGFSINAGFMEACNEDYADQVSPYGWLLGEKIGDENVVVMIDEIVAKYMPDAQPLLRVANHRARVSHAHQLKLYARIKRCFDAIQSGHIFSDLSREDNDARCETLEQTAIGLQTSSAGEDWYNVVARPQYKR